MQKLICSFIIVLTISFSISAGGVEEPMDTAIAGYDIQLVDNHVILTFKLNYTRLSIENVNVKAFDLRGNQVPFIMIANELIDIEYESIFSKIDDKFSDSDRNSIINIDLTKIFSTTLLQPDRIYQVAYVVDLYEGEFTEENFFFRFQGFQGQHHLHDLPSSLKVLIEKNFEKLVFDE